MSSKDLLELKKSIARMTVIVKRMEKKPATQIKKARRGKKGVSKPQSKTPEQVLVPQVQKPRKTPMCKKCGVPRKNHKCEKNNDAVVGVVNTDKGVEE